MSLYLNNVYGDPETEAWFRDRYAASGKKLDMGKSCVRFRHLDDLALDVIGETIARTNLRSFLAQYVQARGSSRIARRTADPMRLASWLDEYRTIRPDSVERIVAEPIDDWQEPDLIVSPDLRPRWRERAKRVGYGRPSQL